MVRLIWDFLFGVILIGGAPLGVMALTAALGDLYQSVFHVIIGETAGMIVSVAMLFAAIAAFACAIRFRLRRRLLPRRIIWLEVLFGITGAFLFYMLCGVLMYSAIG